MKVLPHNAKILLPEKCDLKASVTSFRDSGHDLSSRLGHTFVNKSLLDEAITHSSSPSAKASYERLEFVGDAVLGELEIYQKPLNGLICSEPLWM